jgi:hypothetical protein
MMRKAIGVGWLLKCSYLKLVRRKVRIRRHRRPGPSGLLRSRGADRCLATSLMRFFPHCSLGPEEEQIEPEDAVDACPQLAVLPVCARALLEKCQKRYKEGISAISDRSFLIQRSKKIHFPRRRPWIHISLIRPHRPYDWWIV